MRYAFITDIHANLQALNAVLTDIATQRIDRILCLGDSVGYGPNPSEVLASLYRHVDGFCMGNHDAVICGKLDANLFNEHARHMIRWTRRQLSEKAVRFLASQPLTLTGPGFRCTHGDFTEPAAFHYIESADDAAPNWHVVNEPLLICGHTHVPALFVIGDSGKTHELPPQLFELEPNKRYLVNPGSAGNPRSGDALATYSIFDDTTRTVRWQSVPFDLDACRDAIKRAGLNERDTRFLALDPRRRLSTIREEIDFSPARDQTQQAHDVQEVSELTKLSRSAKRWKRAAAGSMITGLTCTAAAIAFLLLQPQPANGPLLIPESELPAVMPHTIENNWLPPFPLAAVDRHELPAWRVRLDNREITSLRITTNSASERILSVIINGDQRARFRIESAAIRVSRSGPTRYTLRSRLERSDDFNGFVRFAVEQLGPLEDGIYPVLMRETKDPPPISPHIRFTTDAAKVDQAAKYVRLVIEGEYRGIAEIEEPTLTPKDD